MIYFLFYSHLFFFLKITIFGRVRYLRVEQKFLLYHFQGNNFCASQIERYESLGPLCHHILVGEMEDNLA